MISVLSRKSLKLSNMVKKWIPVVLWAALIFSFSSDAFSSSNTESALKEFLSWLIPEITSEQFDAVHLAIRKIAHWAEYFVLSILLLRALESERRTNWQWRSVVWTLLLVLIYAVADELHQAFVPSRSALVDDVLVDFFGGGCGILWMYTLRKRPGAREKYHGDQRRDDSEN
jgi:VanZ family protein